MRDVGDSGISGAARATERAIQRERRVAVSSGLQGGNATVRNFGRTTSDILQPGGYRRASSKCPWATTTKSDMGGVSTVEQLLKEMENLKIAMVKKSDNRPKSSKYTDRRCIWCNSAEHDRRDYDQHKEAL